eukprot:TRINITY_DN12738_c0_g5_i2.p1 TRINITY_DN12738_c0_g5~~TRINITY_DN12738_c0_g5_i2.p1  ORF type:complete len:226 (-),score=35.30 TRINITY_DN12738_c0_g5_i2:112-789(-)
MRSASQDRDFPHKKTCSIKPFARLKKLLRHERNSLAARYTDMADKEVRLQFPYIKNTRSLLTVADSSQTKAMKVWRHRMGLHLSKHILRKKRSAKQNLSFSHHFDSKDLKLKDQFPKLHFHPKRTTKDLDHSFELKRSQVLSAMKNYKPTDLIDSREEAIVKLRECLRLSKEGKKRIAMLNIGCPKNLYLSTGKEKPECDVIWSMNGKAKKTIVNILVLFFIIHK